MAGDQQRERFVAHLFVGHVRVIDFVLGKQ